jgi:hypothetical protein
MRASNYKAKGKSQAAKLRKTDSLASLNLQCEIFFSFSGTNFENRCLIKQFAKKTDEQFEFFADGEGKKAVYVLQ